MIYAQIAKTYQININELFQKIFSKENIQIFILRMVKERLYNRGLHTINGRQVITDHKHGIDPEFYKLLEKAKKKIGGATYRDAHYTQNTNIVKKSGVAAGGVRPINRVTLLGSGSLYDSFDIIIRDSFIDLIADFDNSKYTKFTSLGIFYNFQKSFVSKTEFRKAVMYLYPNELNKLKDTLKIELQKELLKKHNAI